mmetsp:Transcript_1458/g.3030  ORF Transcript_1458/g.3030 Transcript_1458/m.3030 type:complete len:214 (+) Transcript_1458:1193-1834(+)
MMREQQRGKGVWLDEMEGFVSLSGKFRRLSGLKTATICSCESGRRLCDRPYLSRRAVLNHGMRVLVSVGAGLGLVSGLVQPESKVAYAESTDPIVADCVSAVRRARTRLDDVPALVKAAKWDSVRTLLATKPVVELKPVLKELGRVSDSDTAGILSGLREDLMTSLRLLDTAVYNNVFVDESRVALGVKVDFITPIGYLNDALDAIDSILELF